MERRLLFAGRWRSLADVATESAHRPWSRTSTFMATTWSRRPLAARCGFSMTSRRCASSTASGRGRMRICLRPRNVVRVRWDMSQDTPLPPETPAGRQSAGRRDSLLLLKSVPAGDIKTLDLRLRNNNLVREFSNVPAPFDKAPANAPEYWFAPPPALPKTAGLNRFTWDLRYPLDEGNALQLLWQSTRLHRVHAFRSCHSRKISPRHAAGTVRRAGSNILWSLT